MAYTTSLGNLRAEIVACDPKMAEKLRATAHYDRQRPISDGHVMRLATEMENKHFIAGTQIHICELRGKQSIVNGNHTLEAIAMSGETIPLTFLYTKVGDEEEMARIYANHDIGKARDWASAIKAAGMFDEMDASQQFVTCFGAALMPILANFQHLSGHRNPGVQTARMSRDMRIEAMREYRPQAEMYHVAVHQARPKLQISMRRQAIFAVALETLKYQPSLAMEFWEGLAKDDGLRKTDPRKVLLADLQERPASGQQKGYQARGAAYAWNAYFDGREINYIRVSPGLPFTLKGTKWGSQSHAVPAAARDEPASEMAHPV